MEQRTKKKGRINYIVDHTLRGEEKVSEVIIRSQTYKPWGIFSQEGHAALVIARAVKKWKVRLGLAKCWKLSFQINVPRNATPYELAVFENVRPELRLHRCKLRLYNPRSGQQFIKYVDSADAFEGKTERDIFIEKNADQEITDVRVGSLSQEEFLFVDYRYPNVESAGTFEICRVHLTPQIAVRLLLI